MDDETPQPVEIPYAGLSETALRGVVEAFVLREGTDYGDGQFTLEQKVRQVMHQLERGEAQIVFDPRLEITEIVVLSQEERRRRRKQQKP